MRVPCLTLIAALLAVATQGNAGEPAPQPQRPLLQPPVVQIPSPITDRFAVRGMYFRPSVSTIVRYDDVAGAAGTRVSGEDTIGLQEHKNQLWLDLMFRMTPRHRIEAQFYQLKRRGKAVLTQSFDFGDDTFDPADGELISRMDLRQLNLGYSYSLLQRDKLEMALGLGIHLLQLTGSVEAPQAFKREELDTAGPFPTLSGDVTWRFTRRFSVNANANYLSFKHSGVKGNSLAWNADLQFRAHRNLAVGLGYSSTNYKLDSSDPDFFSGYLKLKYQGPELFVRAAF
jgi:outer membrane receptor protein involved in Fe transport